MSSHLVSHLEKRTATYRSRGPQTFRLVLQGSSLGDQKMDISLLLNSSDESRQDVTEKNGRPSTGGDGSLASEHGLRPGEISHQHRAQNAQVSC
jgi:hypothetical protein